MEELKQLAFSYIAIMLKMRYAEQSMHATVRIEQLFEKALAQDVPYSNYPQWIAKEIQMYNK